MVSSTPDNPWQDQDHVVNDLEPIRLLPLTRRRPSGNLTKTPSPAALWRSGSARASVRPPHPFSGTSGGVPRGGQASRSANDDAPARFGDMDHRRPRRLPVELPDGHRAASSAFVSPRFDALVGWRSGRAESLDASSRKVRRPTHHDLVVHHQLLGSGASSVLHREPSPPRWEWASTLSTSENRLRSQSG